VLKAKVLTVMDWTKRLAVWSVVIGTIVLGLKYLAYYLTGSIALYSDALESIVNVATAIVALFAIHVSAKPADAGHPFGHSKVEYFSAVIEGVLIVVAARGGRTQRTLVLGSHHTGPQAPLSSAGC